MTHAGHGDAGHGDEVPTVRWGDADIFATRRWRDRGDRAAAGGAETGGEPGGPPASFRMVSTATALGTAGQGSVEWLRAAARAGGTEAMMRLGMQLVDREGPSPEAKRWLRQAAETGSPQGQLHYGRLLLFTGQAEEAEPWLDAAIAASPALATTLVSDLRMRRADELADKWQQKAAEAGDPDAALDLALAAIKRKDHAAAQRWAEWARKLGHPKAELMLANAAMDCGDGQEAWSWTRRAAEAGNVQAAAAYGLELARQGREQEARPFLEQVARADIEQASDGDPGFMDAQGGQARPRGGPGKPGETGHPSQAPRPLAARRVSTCPERPGNALMRCSRASTSRRSRRCGKMSGPRRRPGWPVPG